MSDKKDFFEKPVDPDNCKYLFEDQHPEQWQLKAIQADIEFGTAYEMHSKFGTLGLVLYCSFRSFKFFNLDVWVARMEKESESCDFLTPLLVFYINSIKGEFVTHPASKSKFGLENLNSLISEAPSLKELRTGLRVMKAAEYLPYKCILDILGSFLALFHGKQSKKYKEFLKTYQIFLENVPDHYLT
mmetsp:Transcript_38734/g.58907  ORF Transcript_38734/g.58907 Transcript_38734/m.58907 type:complete len:187 (-) Transcript_38734:294-854(-)